MLLLSTTLLTDSKDSTSPPTHTHTYNWPLSPCLFFILNRFFPSRVTGRVPPWQRQVHPLMGRQVIAGPNVRYLAQGYLSIATKVLLHSPSTTITPAMFLSTPGPRPLHFLAQSPNKVTYYRHLADALNTVKSVLIQRVLSVWHLA